MIPNHLVDEEEAETEASEDNGVVEAVAEEEGAVATSIHINHLNQIPHQTKAMGGLLVAASVVA